jgi:peptidoglycan/LPS O-acetylase OafA/YrhL
MQHIKKLDSLRAIAVLLVIMWHWLPHGVINGVLNGAFGVNIFFVLSGFLITGILLANRDKAEKLKNPKLVVFKNFYIRRILRIFPVYYLLLLLLLIFHHYFRARLGRGEFISSLFYTSNFYFFKHKVWGTHTGHFWSLAVEEQFYLFWPFIILFINKKYLIHAICIFISIGVITQCFINDQFGYMPTYTCFDSFGLGALLAWMIKYKPQLLNTTYKIVSAIAVCCALTIISQIVFNWWLHLPLRTMHSVIALWMITYVVLQKGEKKISFSSFLNNRVFFFIGKISYGIYLYHIPIQRFGFVLSRFIKKTFPSGFMNDYTGQIVLVTNFCLLIFVSWLSWILVERPILSLKKYFDYQNKKQVTREEKMMAVH